MLSINENIFSKKIVKTFFDLKIKVKYAILRLKNLEYYIGKEKSKRYLLELEEFNKDIKEYMGTYPLEFNEFCKDFFNDILELEKYKKEQESLIIKSINSIE